MTYYVSSGTLNSTNSTQLWFSVTAYFVCPKSNYIIIIIIIIIIIT